MLALVLAQALAESPVPKIVNGEEVPDAAFPEVVAVLSGSGTCTGSLVHPEWVLTAAHCWDGVDIANVPDGNARVFFGNALSGSGTYVAGDAVIVHPGYLSIGPSPNAIGIGADGTENDVSLVHLAEPWNGPVMALNDAPIDDAWIGLDVTFVGFGITAWQANDSGTKRFVGSQVDAYEALRVFDFDPVGGGSTCQGDSGGPGLRYQGDGYIQFSITAFGRECGTSPGGHMRVDAYLPWIRESIAPADVLTEAARPPTFDCDRHLDPDDPASIALGVVPMELACRVSAADPENVTSVDWSWGDGTTERRADLDASHTYDAQGIYSVSACVTTEIGEAAYEHCIRKTNHVHACDVPEPAFDATPDGLTVELVNRTPLRAWTCVSNATWDVFAGDRAEGTPIATLDGWEPDLVLDARGTYTVVLNVGGLGGTGAAETTVTVGRATGCVSVPLPPGWLGFALIPLLSRRRSRFPFPASNLTSS